MGSRANRLGTDGSDLDRSDRFLHSRFQFERFASCDASEFSTTPSSSFTRRYAELFLLQALVLDIVPSHQQNQGNAWLGRQTHFANILGYLCGFFDLGSVPALQWIGGGQFRRLGVISCVVMASTVAITCFTQEEEKRTPNEVESGSAWKRIFVDIKDNIRDLPIEVRRVCYVQFFSWTAWFPLLFYSCVSYSLSLELNLPKIDLF